MKAVRPNRSHADSRTQSAVNILELVATCPRRTLAAGAVLKPADISDVRLCVVEAGLVVLKSGPPGSARRTITCHAGSGALILAPGSEEVLVALSDATLRLISARERTRLLEAPEAAGALLDALSETLRQKHETIATLARFHHVDRIRETLVGLARAHGRVGREAIRLDFPLTHELLGEMSGSARETVTRAMDELQRDGFVERRGRTYSIHVSPDPL